MSDRITVIADDLTGAAEIAGVGLRHGLRVELVPDATTLRAVPEAPLVVMNTDSRGLPPRDAAARVRLVATTVGAARVYKKIDSVLRGPVLAEVEAMLDAMPRFRRAIVVAQNPSRGRTVDADGTYRVDGVPLVRTAFASDPDHPRRTANAFELLGPSDRATLGPAATLDDVRRHATALDDDVLPVGSADFFQAFLERLHAGAERARVAPARPPIQEAGAAPTRGAPARRQLFVSGTADRATRKTLVERMRDLDAPCGFLPQEWFVGDGIILPVMVARWAEPLTMKPVAALLTPTKRFDPRRGETLLCDAAAGLIEAPVALYVDGGATAMALCRRMGWTALDVVAEVGPGAVTLAPSAGIEMTIKPGSYAWPAAVWATLGP